MALENKNRCPKPLDDHSQSARVHDRRLTLVWNGPDSNRRLLLYQVPFAPSRAGVLKVVRVEGLAPPLCPVPNRKPYC